MFPANSAQLPSNHKTTLLKGIIFLYYFSQTRYFDSFYIFPFPLRTYLDNVVLTVFLPRKSPCVPALLELVERMVSWGCLDNSITKSTFSWPGLEKANAVPLN